MKKNTTSQPLPGGGTKTTSTKGGQKTITISGANNISINPNTGQISTHSFPYPNLFFSHNNVAGRNSPNSGQTSKKIIKTGISFEKVTSLKLSKEQVEQISKSSTFTSFKTSDDYQENSSSESAPKPSKP